jgi:hypothetical protein
VGTPALDSDVDIAVDRRAEEVLQLLEPGLVRAGIVAALVWPYDVGGGASCFFARADGSGGAQLDMLYDPHGRGRYGLRTSQIIADRKKGERYPVPEQLDRLLYAIVKSRLKGKHDQVRADVERVEAAAGTEMALTRAKQLFSPAVASLVRKLLDQRPARKIARPTRWVRSVLRIAGRLRRPIGYWVEIIGPSSQAKELAEELEARLSRWLVVAGSGARPQSSRTPVWWLTRVAPVRWRAGTFVSWSERARSALQADLTLPIADIDVLTRRVIGEMATRASL